MDRHFTRLILLHCRRARSDRVVAGQRGGRGDERNIFALGHRRGRIRRPPAATGWGDIRVFPIPRWGSIDFPRRVRGPTRSGLTILSVTGRVLAEELMNAIGDERRPDRLRVSLVRRRRGQRCLPLQDDARGRKRRGLGRPGNSRCCADLAIKGRGGADDGRRPRCVWEEKVRERGSSSSTCPH